MKLIRPPRWAERILGGAGASAELRDDVIGDLGEEFMIRAAYDGERAARRWYVREAWRTLPHLLRDWRTGARRDDFMHVASAVGRAYVTVAVVAGAALLTVNAFLAAAGVHWFSGGFAPRSTVLTLASSLGLAIPVAMFGGFVAARFGRRAPPISAALLGLFWSTLALSALVIVRLLALPNQVPLQWALAQVLLVIAGTTAGGVVSVNTSSDSADAEPAA